MNQINFFGPHGPKPKEEKPKEEKQKAKSIGAILSEKQGMNLLIALAIIGIALIYLGRGSGVTTNVGVKQQIPTVETDNNKISALEKEYENKLQANLQQMAGVGKIQVLVTLETSTRNDYATNANVTKRTDKETDKQGGTRETTEVDQNNQLVIPNGTTQPVIIMENRPEVAGVLVIAEGANNPLIKEEINSAVKTLLNISASKIQVEPMGGM